jgi:hypothetical protein
MGLSRRITIHSTSLEPNLWKSWKKIKRRVLLKFSLLALSGLQYTFHPLGAVPKGLDDCRIVKDSSACGFNEASVKTKMALPDIRTIINSVKKGWWGATFDLSSAFHQLPIRPELSNLVCFMLPDGTFIRARTAWFGGKNCPFLMQGTSMHVREVVLRSGLVRSAVVVYLDDFTFLQGVIWGMGGHCSRSGSVYNLCEAGWIGAERQEIAFTGPAFPYLGL